MLKQSPQGAGMLGLVVVLAVVSTGCQAQTPVPLFPRAIITKENVDSALAIEAIFTARGDSQPPAGVAWLAVVRDSSPVLILAPHATPQMREGRLKPADGGSGSLAIMLARLTGSSIIYTTYASQSDPNYYDDNAFKDSVRILVAAIHPVLVLDLHASHWRRPYDVDFGTMNSASLLGNSAIIRSLGDALMFEGISNLSQDYFAASSNHTDTRFVAGLGVPCIQLEINSSWLLGPDSALQEHRFSSLLQGLVRYVRSVRHK